MAKPFDIATRHLVEQQPEAWLQFLQLKGRFKRWIEADLTAVAAEADKVLEIEAEVPYLTHIEFQSSYDSEMDWRVFHYNALLTYRYRQPVQSVLILLRPEADGTGVRGSASYQVPGGAGSLAFHYQVVRLWETPVETLLAGGLATLPLAPLAAVSEGSLPEVVRRMESRLLSEASVSQAGDLWTATYLLMGLRYARSLTEQLLQGVRNMKESVTYQAILQEGEEKGEARGLSKGLEVGLAKGLEEGLEEGLLTEARNLILRLGGKRYGAADARVVSLLLGIDSLEQLEQLAERLLEAESWQELLNDV